MLYELGVLCAYGNIEPSTWRSDGLDRKARLLIPDSIVSTRYYKENDAQLLFILQISAVVLTGIEDGLSN